MRYPILRCVCTVLLLFVADASRAQEAEVLPGTERLDWTEQGPELADRLMAGAQRFAERRIDDVVVARRSRWDRDQIKSPKSDSTHRDRLASILGVVDLRTEPDMERFGRGERSGLVTETEDYKVWQVRWPVLKHVWGEGLLVEPVRPSIGTVILVPDADEEPEDLLGLTGASTSDPARRLAEHGFQVLVMTPVSRTRRERGSTRPELMQSDREWIFRQGFYMGRHVIGYEVQKVQAAVDWIDATGTRDVPIGVAGYGEGGLVGFYAAALDQRIDAALVSGYFGPRSDLWREPIYRQVWSLLSHFGGAEIASLIAPRKLVVEYAPVPPVDEPLGQLETPPIAEVRAEIERANALAAGDSDFAALVTGSDGRPAAPMSRQAIERFARHLGLAGLMPLSDELPVDRREDFNPEERSLRQAAQMNEHVQMLVDQSDYVQDRFFLHKVLPELSVPDAGWNTERGRETFSPERFDEEAESYRAHYGELIGRIDGPRLPPRPRTRKIMEGDKWTAYDVVLDVHDDLIAWGMLIIPKGITPGEQRPAVVCQHGRNGLPATTTEPGPSYYSLAVELAEKGFVTFSPHNLYREESQYRWLDRKAKTTGITLFSFIISQHEQIVDWLASLDVVDSERIGLYGKSFGGLTGLRVPPLVKGYALSIVSGYFNDETRKVAGTEHRFSYMNTDEWEIPVWNLGHTFGHAEAAYLMVPRPFMVERGSWDLVALDRWVAYEFAKVRFLYRQLGIGDRAQIEFFQGGHAINGEGTYRFLETWLDWSPDEQR